ncbi:MULTISPECIES: amidophosphoribosyltransferase [Bacillus]|uniref:Amidophosphoribosyltransferase n=1 Tax=Bacillus licheniformis (strain ATCC 14580 / DSM 13 / JCM 2505 / CCUG 7422 / NBRC 12200 / NCIMB 9375 / NCTC 10341 / NRRL NRS-1264 / Gibson 46) TaxID=279010 RepID=Q62Y72_BACLD|nr:MULTISPECIES: amidophosphoribosyltransferase [Bacillus]AAU22286.1 glutamine phosphoribosylpyrophosphate amidotransferase [Bacillus licheniformis DSM 13 = ATCC 14580]MBG9698517.1 amidophosphoribosyltransferase [Bacillus licheniformis]MCR3917315.1 amidophosphoribosyltransferase [Bacillus licheniformis]MDE1440830.1 amidophosphoribosyltransferase [Bacillus licheniformis]MDH3164696.1 amidophosphoribosyltransferase [Bacillus licheniformis]
MLAEIKGLNEECGVFGIWGHEEAPQITYYGLHSLQHRGQEGAGIVATDGEKMSAHKGQGLITEVFQNGELKKVKGKGAIGHVRYATAGGGGFENVQPFLFHSQNNGSLALAHNGNLVNATQLKQQLENQGSIFQTSSDTEVLAHLIKRSGHFELKDQIKNALSMLKGAYAFLIMTEKEMIVAHDPNGLRPLSVAMLGDAYVVASETCAFDVVGATYLRDVEPGEMLIINDEGMKSERFSININRSICSMEYIYFSRPDSNINGINVHSARKNLGKKLAEESGIEADVVTGVPDSSISAAIGYAEATGIPYELGLIKNRYVGRTFIQPSQSLREQGVRMKLSAVRGVVEGKRVVMVDDSIVRGTTSRRIVTMLREAGATEVHVRISSPPIAHPCFYGIDTSTHEELIASSHSVEEIRQEIGADTLSFLSIEGLLSGIGRQYEGENCGQCMACFTGKYPTEIYQDTVLPHVKEIVLTK